MRSYFAIAAILALRPFTIDAQDRMPADEIVQRLRGATSLQRLNGEVAFRDCPQADAHGRRVFESLASIELQARVLAEIAGVWNERYASCEYGPLEAWYERALERIVVSDDDAALWLFLDATPADISPRMREVLWQVVATRHTEGEMHDVLAANAVDASDPAQRVALTVAAIRDRPVRASFISAISAQHLRQEPRRFVPALAQAVDGMPDDRLGAVLRSMQRHIDAGELTPVL